jgi:hypothetical protein
MSGRFSLGLSATAAVLSYLWLAPIISGAVRPR